MRSGRASHKPVVQRDQIAGGSDRGFGFVFAGFFAILAIYSYWTDGSNYLIFLGVSAAFLAVAVTMPRVLAPLNRLWTRFGILLAKIVNPVVMAGVFFIAVTPIGLLMRLAGKDLLRLRYDSTAETYWIMRTPPGPPPDTMKNQF